jgi:histidinol phosphatase-like PHP family hydrolase
VAGCSWNQWPDGRGIRTHGLNAEQVLRQIDQIDALNERLSGITLLKGVEVDILEEGDLDLPDDILRRLDLVVADTALFKTVNYWFVPRMQPNQGD